MQVMQTSELSKTEVLVGQKNITKNFGVSDDPMLMSMLSTGFYANPLRTMIQEVMFNAWDAHRMGNCLDKPIDIYINKESGLIIRDYGPGIHDEDIHPIYCIYGSSTKRNDSRQTGGFGLGSKSPFAYTESFTVTSMHEGTKCMYLISRVSEDGGKPGLTKLLETPVVHDHGLMVTINLAENDYHRAKRYVIELLFLSGISARLHWKDDEPILIESKTLAPGQYVTNSEYAHDGNGIYAVYGGVRYRLQKHDDFAEEYEFLVNLANSNSSLFIGFAPNSLTPLPNREGLNMSEKSREAIKAGLELCLEQFRTILQPLCDGYIAACFDYLAETKVQAHFALSAGFRIGHCYHPLTSIRDDYCKIALENCLEECEPSLWKIVVNVLLNRPHHLMDAFGVKDWAKLVIKHFCRVYPDNKKLAYLLLKEDIGDLAEHNRYQKIDRILGDHLNPGFNRELFNFHKELAALFPEDETLHPTLYVDVSDVWLKVSHEKVRQKKERIGDKKIPGLRPSPKKVIDSSSLFFSKSGDTVDHIFMQKTIFLAKTLNTLRSTNFQPRNVFTSGKYYPSNTYASQTYIIGCVVHSRKGAYEAAKKLLVDNGWNVIEADEPEKRVATKSAPTFPTYPRISLQNSSWVSGEIEDQIENPSHYLYITQSVITERDWRSYALKPERSLVEMMIKLHPDMVLITNKLTADKLEKQRIPTFAKAVESWFNSLTTKKYRFRNIVRAIQLLGKSNIPPIMLRDPRIQKALGMVPIEPDDTLAFWEEVQSYQTVLKTSFEALNPLLKQASNQVDEVWKADPMKLKISSYCIQTKFFYESSLERSWRQSNEAQKEELAKKISRFVRDI